VLKIAGDLTRRTCSLIQYSIRELVRRGHRDVALDLSRVRRLDSAGTATLVKVFEDRRRARGHLQIVSASDSVQRRLEGRQLGFLLSALLN
jgi:anti-anti-sigma factor